MFGLNEAELSLAPEEGPESLKVNSGIMRLRFARGTLDGVFFVRVLRISHVIDI
jgi:hypothetical protein